MWRSLFLVGLLSLLLLSGCASRFEKALDEVRTGDEAERRFGPPTKTEELADGGLRREWLLRTQHYSGDSYGDADYAVSVGGYGSGFGIWLSKFFGSGSSYSDTYCRLDIVTNQEGTVVQRRWQGDDCERLLRGR